MNMSLMKCIYIYILNFEYAMNYSVCFVYFLQWGVFIEIHVSSLTYII